MVISVRRGTLKSDPGIRPAARSFVACAAPCEASCIVDYDNFRARHHNSPYVLVDHIARRRSYAGNAAVRLVARLKKQVAAAGIPWFLGEIHADNERSAAFFIRALRAERVWTTHRGGHPWIIYAAPV